MLLWELCKQELSLSLLHFLTTKLSVSADRSGKLNPPESHQMQAQPSDY